MIFRDQEYKVNIKGGKTVFSPVGQFELGDRIVFEVIRRKYKADNPDEQIFFSDQIFDPEVVQLRLQPQKFFWADVSSFANPPREAICYKLYEEAEALRGLKMYPQFSIHPDSVSEGPRKGGNSILLRNGEFLNKEYMVLHFRNIKKRPEKNVVFGLANALFQYLMNEKKRIVLVGNDEPYGGMITNFSAVLDLRGKLSLTEIAHVLKQAKLFIGSDSGIAHLAGACSECPLVVFGLWKEIYKPKVGDGRLQWLVKENSSFEAIINKIEGVVK